MIADPTQLRPLVAELEPELVALRHDLHQHPELGYEERRTSHEIRRVLEAAGVAFVGDLAGGTGVVAHLPGRGASAVGLRADIDALPIHEETGLPWASRHEGRMHACGHDGHTTMLLGAVRTLAALAQDHPLPNPVTFVFQPAEEGGAGGQRMVEDGCLDGLIGPRVSRMYGLHGWPGLPVGEVSSRPGPLLAAANEFEIEVTGRGGHAAMPHLTADPVAATASIVQAVQTIVSRRTDPARPLVVSLTTLEAGHAHNVIPGRARITGTVRTLDDDVLRQTRDLLGELISTAAALHGCTTRLDFHEGYPVTRNDEQAYETFRRIAEGAVGADRVHRERDAFMGGEDFAYYGQRVPACFFFLGLQRPGAEPMAGLHHPRFDFTDEAIGLGVELLCRLALEG